MTCRSCSLFLIALLGVLAGCSSGPSRQPEIGEAYAGPATLKLRGEIDPQSAVVATVHHGDRLGIVRRRRRFVKVRTSNGVEGWTDLRQLLASAQMEELNQLAERAARLPSQGAATVYEALNVHNEPNRQAPSFYQIKEGELCDVVAHELSPRIVYDAKSILPPAPKKPPAAKPKSDDSRTPRVSPPPPPKPPDNWEDLAKWPPEAPEPEPVPPKPVPMDDWTLVRLKNGRAGWVLTAQLKMNIPDEVAQYSEGHRITSYFPMMEIRDGDQIRYNWLWTTLSTSRVPWEFDSFRYFIWNVRHHRYETAYVQRDLKGYYPVEVHPVEASFNKKTEKFPGFSLTVEQDGVRYRKTYAYQLYLVRLISTEKLGIPTTPPPQAVAGAHPQLPPAKPAPTGLAARWKALRQRWFGK